MNSSVLILPIAVLAFAGLVFLLKHVVDGNLAQQYGKLLAERSIAGVSSAALDQEMTLRMAAIRFRREVSEAVMQVPLAYETYIREIGKEHAMQIAVTDKSSAKAFVDWIEAAALDEILLPPALKLVEQRAMKSVGATQAPMDLAFSLRVIG